MTTLLWVLVPYLSIAVFVGGLIWRYRYDQFGWTTRSSQLYESRLLRLGSPMFHVGVLLVLLGHVGGLLVPKAWTEAAGISEHVYHLAAVFIGTVAGTFTLLGLAILVARRRLTGPVFTATTRNDKVMYLLLGGVLALGLGATLLANARGDGYDYRETISPWLRSLLLLRPQPQLMTGVPLTFGSHVLASFALFAFWPFSRLVHAFSAPVGYLTRPYVVYRRRDLEPSRTDRGSRRGLRPTRRGWEGQT